MAAVPFSAVLLAGGASRRMGVDKATLRLGGEALWQKQLRVLRQLAPAQLFISGHPDGPYAAAGVEIIADPLPGAGPLGGLVAGLRRAETPWLVVLAIDLPLMPAPPLAALLERAIASGKGRIPAANGRSEPLAAVYPKAALVHAERALAAGELALQSLTRELIESGLAEPDPLAKEQPELFRNANTPEEWERIQRICPQITEGRADSRAS